MKSGIVKSINKNNKGANEAFTKLIEIQSDNYVAFYYHANAEFNLKQIKEALTDYNKASELKPDYPDAYFNRGLYKQFVNDKNGYCNDLSKAKALGRLNLDDILKYCYKN